MKDKPVDKAKVFEFLVNLRDSGATNMLGASPYIKQAFRVSDKQAVSLLADWIRTFDTPLKNLK